MKTLRVVGPGRAGRSLAAALSSAGWRALAAIGRDAPERDLAAAGEGVDLLVIATPDDVIADVASRIDPVDSTVIAHLSGSQTLDVLAPHGRRASIHPLVSLPDAEAGAARLRGAWFAIAGDPLAADVVADLEGRALFVDDGDRAGYHAAAVVASNHLVALLGQVERLAATAGVPLAAYLDLVRATVDNVERLGTQGALTGPVARGDWSTLARHLAAIDPSERAAYVALAEAAARLANRSLPPIPPPPPRPLAANIRIRTFAAKEPVGGAAVGGLEGS
ncbi:MAG TPA: DUF2520 domain-containing protein [Acidimicrobiales bacterium]|nr:DUF2520 domain-containing protein [Acidimicrobiales bacterium]